MQKQKLIKTSKYFNKPEEQDQFISGLKDIKSLMDSDLFTLDQEIENEMYKDGDIESHVDDMKLVISEAIQIFDDIIKGGDQNFEGYCPECGSDDLDNLSGGIDSSEVACEDCNHKFGIESKGWIIN